MKTAIMSITGLKDELATISALLNQYRPVNSINIIGNADNKPIGSPVSTWYNRLFSFIRFTSQYSTNNFSFWFSITTNNRNYCKANLGGIAAGTFGYQ